MAGSAITACRTGGLALSLAAASCGLAVSGAGSDSTSEDGTIGMSSSSGGLGSSSSGGSGGTGDDSASDFDAPSPGDDGGQPPAEASVLGPSDARADTGKGVDSGPHDASGVDAASYCPKLDACCALLMAFGVSNSSIASCYASAASGSSSTCLTVLATFQSVGFCY